MITKKKKKKFRDFNKILIDYIKSYKLIQTLHAVYEKNTI